MKKLFRKNQIIITGLAMLIAVAGYLKYADEGAASGKLTADASRKVEDETGNEPGEAIMVNADTSLDIMINAKLQREQVRAENKEQLMEIVNNVDLTEAEKKSAVDKVVELAEISEKELAAETSIMAKGVKEVVVNMLNDNVEVIVGAETLDDATRIQIEDIVKRTFEVGASNMTISLVSEK